MVYQDILKNLVESLPEIHGAFIYNRSQGIINSQEKIPTDSLQKENIGKVIYKVFFMMSDHFNDISNIRFNYKKMTLIGGKFLEKDYLIVLCGQNISSGLTRITVQMALNNLKESRNTTFKTQTHVDDQPTVSPEELLGPDSPLSKQLIQIKHELNKQIGPMANVLYEDALTNWAKQFSPTHDSLQDLIKILVEIIGEGNKGEDFRTAVSKFI